LYNAYQFKGVIFHIHIRCTEITGTIYSFNAAGPLPCRVTNASRLTTAVGDMQTACTNAAGRSNPNFLNLDAGNIGGKTPTPGLYKWTTAVSVPSNITISGSPNAIWIFQVAGTPNVSSAVHVTLAGGTQAKNIFWQVAGAVTLGTTCHFDGIIPGKTGINMQTDATITGRLLAQTAVILEMSYPSVANTEFDFKRGCTITGQPPFYCIRALFINNKRFKYY